MVKTLELALSKIAALPEAAQEEFGRQLLKQVDELNVLRAELEVGIRQLDAGLGRELDLADFLRRAREEHARKA
jgi:hypothetical protein